MYNNHITQEAMKDNDHEEEFYNLESKRIYSSNWSSPEDSRFILRHKFASPRILSKSLPRRNKNLVRYKINRSLNFDIGSTRNETFKSPNSSLESIEDEKQLTRSAKIMRALNYSSSPLNSEKRKIKKSLNFDLLPNPNGLKNIGRSPHSVLNAMINTPSPKINKTLNFDTSPSDSDASSALMMSSESIDENQNQTPSRQDRKAKKSLNYLSPNVHVASPKIGVASPMLRSGLKQKIDSIVQISATPKLYLQRSSHDSINIAQNASTPRNLYNDFSEDEDDRPETPENMIRIIPESMSAIKKSHKKERLSRRAEHVVSQETQLYSGEEDSFTNETERPLPPKQRPLTPPGNDKYPSPTYNVNSIKRSHKKDKSKKRSLDVRSEDELSDTGSIFDYSEMQQNDSVEENISNEQVDIDSPKETVNNSLSSVNEESCDAGNTIGNSPQFEKEDSETLNDSIEELNGRSCAESSKSTLHETVNDPVPIITVSENEPKTPPRKVLPGTSGKPATPENRINFLQRIATESIKKSHRKVKDENRKKLFKPRSLHNDIDMPYDSGRPENKADDEQEDKKTMDAKASKDGNGNVIDLENNARACTPENVNSSRLLLSQYSSVKKSHKKDKHINIISKFAKRQKYLKTDDVAREETHASSESSFDGDLCSMSDSDCKENNPDAGTSANVNACKTVSFPDKLSPSKRKISLDESFSSNGPDELPKPESIEYESAGEEFQIFTPIKKRKSLFLKSNAENSAKKEARSKNNLANETAANDVSRCMTPVNRHYNASKAQSVASGTPRRNGKTGGESDEEGPSSDDPNGRLTPKNILSTAELLTNIASIKKSHKKDKRGSILQRTLASACENAKHNQTVRANDYGSPRPSTSRQNVEMEEPEVASRNEDLPIDKTPPNCLKVKSYIRLLQTTSIKRSHKKVRDKRKSVVVRAEDPELSDDGSLFGEEDKADSAQIGEDESRTDLREPYNLRTVNNCTASNNKLINRQSKYRMS